jgi:hypothetical protein
MKDPSPQKLIKRVTGKDFFNRLRNLNWELKHYII